VVVAGHQVIGMPSQKISELAKTLVLTSIVIGTTGAPD
jgi:hypothetical protein